MSIWTNLGVEPTSDIGAIRRAHAAAGRRLGAEAGQDGRLHELRLDYETAALWCAIGYPPDLLSERSLEGVEAGLQAVLAPDRGETPGRRAPREAARIFFSPGGLSEPTRRAMASLRDPVEALTTALERGAPAGEQVEWMTELIEHPSLRDPDTFREVDSILPYLLVSSKACDGALETALVHFHWRRINKDSNYLQQFFVSHILARLHANALLESLRDDARDWRPFRLFPDRDALASEVLTGRFRPRLFLYASSIGGVWSRIRENWEKLGDLPEPYVRAFIEPRTYEYWRSRMTSPSRLLSVARALQVPVTITGMAAGAAVMARILLPRDPGLETTALCLLGGPVVLFTTAAARLLWFGAVRLAATFTHDFDSPEDR